MNKYERCLWLINTLCDYGNSSLSELNERWKNYSLNYDQEELTARTFARDKEFIASTFQLDIEYDARIRKYKLTNQEDIQSNPLYKYLLSCFHINNLSSIAMKHKNKVMLDNTPTGIEYLHLVLDAIDKQRSVCFSYRSYYAQGQISNYEVIPCFVRMFEHRWYLICEYIDHSQTRVLALERMLNLSTGSQIVIPSPEITPDNFYQDCFGIIRDNKTPEEIHLKVYNQQVDYIQSVPIHHSQKEIEKGKDYCVFRYYLRPSFDFIQQIFWHLDSIEIVSPMSLRQEMKAFISKMTNRYDDLQQY